jgi:hypothetical protein
MLIRDKSGNQIQQRGFSAPGRAQHHQQLTAVQRQVDILQRRFTAVIGVQICNIQHGASLFHKTVGHVLAVIRRDRRHFALLFQEGGGIDNRFVHRPGQLLHLLRGVR